MVITLTYVQEHERGLRWRRKEFRGAVGPGWHAVFDPLRMTRLQVVSMRGGWFNHPELDLLARSGALAQEIEILELKDHERALVWINGRFSAIAGPGRHALWKTMDEVRVERLDIRAVRLEHPELATLAAQPQAAAHLNFMRVEAGNQLLYFKDGAHAGSLGPGLHAFWKEGTRARLVAVDLREQSLDIGGQEIMTADRVTLRLNAAVSFRLADPLKAVTESSDWKQALYREGQLALREAIGSLELDALLASKEELGARLANSLRAPASALGIAVGSVGIRDIILPGEMKAILNKVTEARKAAEAAVITRREETAAMRSQANTAKMLENNPTLMRMRELEVIEHLAAKANLTLVLGEQGIGDRVVKML